MNVNPIIGPSPIHFDRTICLAVWCHSSGEIITSSKPCLSAVEAERVHESMEEFFNISIEGNRVGILCVPNGRVIAISDVGLSPDEIDRIRDSLSDYFELFLCPAGSSDLTADDVRELQLACE